MIATVATVCPHKPKRAPRGFSLVELMLVVVIIGILSSFAFPYYQKMSARARRAEMQALIDKMHLYFFNIYENNGTYGTFTPSPANFNPPTTSGPVTGQPANWDPTVTGWTQYTFPPDGMVRLRYSFSQSNATMTITVEGDFPGLGAKLPGHSGNYLYSEILTGTSIDKTTITEIPTF